MIGFISNDKFSFLKIRILLGYLGIEESSRQAACGTNQGYRALLILVAGSTNR
jgi:hypothetical protein